MCSSLHATLILTLLGLDVLVLSLSYHATTAPWEPVPWTSVYIARWDNDQYVTCHMCHTVSGRHILHVQPLLRRTRRARMGQKGMDGVEAADVSARRY